MEEPESDNNCKEIKSLIDDLISLIENDLIICKHHDKKRQNEENDLTYLLNNDLIFELDEYIRHIEDFSVDLQLDTNLFMSSLKCDACKCKQSLFWRRVAPTKIVCNSCFHEKAYLILFDDEHLNKKLKTKENNNNGEPNSSLNTSLNQSQSSLNSNANKKSKSKNKPEKRSQKSGSNQRPLTRNNKKNLESDKAPFHTQLSSSSSSSSLTTHLDSLVRKSARIQCKASQSESNQSLLKNEANEEPQEEISINRRTKMFKKQVKPVKLVETSVSRVCTSDYVFHRGFFMQCGDIVALLDEQDRESIYFAQIRAFTIDESGHKSAILTWLVPKSAEHKRIQCLSDFDPDLFALGLAEEYPRSLDCMEFVCRLGDRQTIKNDESNRYFDSLTKYKMDLLKHTYAIKEAGHIKLITTKEFLNKHGENDFLLHCQVQCK